MKNQQEPTMITGGAGFIGSHIADRLISSGTDVTVLDNFSSGNKENIRACIEKSSFRLVLGDITNPKDLLPNLKDIKTIYHMAAYPEVRTGYENPELSYTENIHGTYILLENIRKSNVEKIMFASSSVVYGEPNVIPTPETYGPLLPISTYGGSKLACEGLISSYCSNYGIKGVMIRIANVVGSRSRHGVIWDFINKLKKNKEELHILGDGKQTKSYIHVNDCVDGFFFCSNNVKNNVEVFNLGNDSKIDVDSIGKIVCKNMDLKDVRIIHDGGTNDGRGWIGDVRQMQLDISKLNKLGWSPKLSSLDTVELSSKELIKESCI